MAILRIFYFFSGFSALIYEVVWARLLLLAFGSTTIANAMVITSFMLGLGIGSRYFGAYVDRVQNYQKLFAYLQLGIGFSSFLLLIFFHQLPNLYKIIINNLHLSQSGLSIFVFFITIFILFIPTFLIGGTFPVIMKLYIQDKNRIKKGIGLLYGFNTFGGVFGALLAGFFFIRNLGLLSTQLLAISINLFIGIFMLLPILQWAMENRNSKSEVHDFKQERLNDWRKYLPIIAGLTGFASLSCQIFWIRALSIFLTNSTYTFTIILAVFLSGIFIGSLIFAKLSKSLDLYKIFDTV
jgi:spermidine synthase